MEELSLYEQNLRLDVERLLGGEISLPFELPEMPEKLKNAFSDRWPSGCGIENFGRLLRTEVPGWMYSIWERTNELEEEDAERVMDSLGGLVTFWDFAWSFALTLEKNPNLEADELREQALATLNA